MKNESKSNAISVILSPFQRFFQMEASGGIVLIFATVVALIWANSPVHDSYHHLWETYLSIELGDFLLKLNLHHWINDGLMVIFFFVVGLEIKRELMVGELSSVKQASLPIMAAIGGMVVPASIFLFLNTNPEATSGWGVPMATDIAFSLGILSLLGKRVPLSLKVFLVAFAIVDDLGAVIVIALFYTADLQINALMIGMGLYAFLILLNMLNVRSIPVYILIGCVIWYYFLQSGVHPTVAGVLLAFSIPMYRKTNTHTFKSIMAKHLEKFVGNRSDDAKTLDHQQLHTLDHIEKDIYNVQSPLQKLEHRLHGFVTYIVMPVFALANAGITFGQMEMGSFFDSLSIDVSTSLVVGKVVGIFLFTFLAIKLRLASMPPRAKWIHYIGLGFLGGIGFTMSLFISNLAFPSATLLDESKMGILVGSFIAALIGYFILNKTLAKEAK